MFRHIGKKVKVLAIIFFVLLLVAETGGMITLLNVRYYSMDESLAIALLFLVILPAVFVLCWMLTWPLYALGQAADKAEENENRLLEMQRELSAVRKILQDMEKSGAARPAVSGKALAVRSGELPPRRETEPPRRPAAPERPDPADAETWTCRNCKTVNLKARLVCRRCGVSRDGDLAPEKPAAPSAEPPKAEEAPKEAPPAPLRPEEPPVPRGVNLHKTPADMWNCPNCMMDNKADAKNCRYCGFLRPEP